MNYEVEELEEVDKYEEYDDGEPAPLVLRLFLGIAPVALIVTGAITVWRIFGG